MSKHPTHEVDIGSNSLNTAGWVFVDAMPHALPGPIFNELKPALKAAIECYLRESCVIDDAQAQIAELTRQRDELLAALTDLLKHFTKTPSTLADSEARRRAHAAIASTKAAA